MKIYRSPYEAYPFLADDIQDFRCDFEILSDEIACTIGLLNAKNKDPILQETLLWLCEMVYHINPTLRTRFSITDTELEKLSDMVKDMENNTKDVCHGFLLPQGCECACIAHILRTKCKALVRLIYRFQYSSNAEVSNQLYDFCNLLSGYFFFLSIYFNKINHTPEIPFISRNYSSNL